MGLVIAGSVALRGQGNGLPAPPSPRLFDSYCFSPLGAEDEGWWDCVVKVPLATSLLFPGPLLAPLPMNWEGRNSYKAQIYSRQEVGTSVQALGIMSQVGNRMHHFHCTVGLKCLRERGA